MSRQTERFLRAGAPALAVLSAAFSANAAQWIGPFTITRVEADASAVYFSKTGDFPNPDNCANAFAVKFEGSDLLVNRAVSIGLTAKATGLRVRFYSNGCSSNNYIRGYSIELAD